MLWSPCNCITVYNMSLINLSSCQNKTNNYLLFLRIMNLYPLLPSPPPPPSIQYGNLSVKYGTSLITVWDISHYSMGRLSLQYGTYLITVWDVSLFSMGHLSIQYGNLSLQCRNLSLQYGTSIHTVCDISHYSMGQALYTVWSEIHNTWYGTYLYIVWDI